MRQWFRRILRIQPPMPSIIAVDEYRAGAHCFVLDVHYSDGACVRRMVDNNRYRRMVVRSKDGREEYDESRDEGA